MIDTKHLLGLPVQTRSEVQVGKIRNVLINEQLHTVLQYEVHTHSLREPLGRTLLIAPAQVVSIESEKMIVEDLAAKDAETRPVPEATA